VLNIERTACRAVSQIVLATLAAYPREAVRQHAAVGAGVLSSRELELPEGVTLDEMMLRLERQLIETTLRRCNYRRDRAAKALGLARSSLFKRLKQWGLGSEEA
jgi:DNA-binding NtrC family response regulator